MRRRSSSAGAAGLAGSWLTRGSVARSSSGCRLVASRDGVRPGPHPAGLEAVGKDAAALEGAEVQPGADHALGVGGVEGTYRGEAGGSRVGGTGAGAQAEIAGRGIDEQRV